MDVQSRWETWLMLWSRKMVSGTRCLGSLIAVRKLGGTSLSECWCIVTILWSLLKKLHLPVNKNNNSTFCIQDKPLLSHGFLIILCSNCWQTFIFLKNEKHCVCEFGGISFPNSWSLISAVVKTLLDSVEVKATENTSERMHEQTFFPFTIHRAWVGI